MATLVRPSSMLFLAATTSFIVAAATNISSFDDFILKGRVKDHNNNNSNIKDDMANHDSCLGGQCDTYMEEEYSFYRLDNASNSSWPKEVGIQILSRFHYISQPVITILGIVSNALSFFIFVSKSLRRTSCSIYLAARSVSDTGFLLFSFFSWLGDMGIYLTNVPVACQVMVFSSYLFGFLSVWLVVFITLENYVRICQPFSVARFCTVQKSRCVLLALIILGVIIYQFTLWMTDVLSAVCQTKPEYELIMTILVYGDMIITLALPSIVIIFFMVAISISLVKSLKRQSRLKRPPVASAPNNHVMAAQVANGRFLGNGAGEGGSHGNGPETRGVGRASTRRSTSPQAKVTKLLFAVSCTFLLLSLPSHIVRLRMAAMTMTSDTKRPSLEEKLHVVFMQLFYMSFAVNLLVYITFGESFRGVFIESYLSCLMGRGLRRRRSEVSQTMYTTVRLEVTEATPSVPEKKEEETSLIS